MATSKAFEKSKKDKDPKGVKEGSAMDNGMDDWQAQSDVHTLTQAHKIKSDPVRHKRAMAHAKSQLAAMQAVAQPVGGMEMAAQPNKPLMK